MARTGRPKAELVLSEDERAALEGWVRRRSTPQAWALRCRIVLECATGASNKDVAGKLGSTAHVVKNRGVADVCMVVCDGLKSLPESIETVWPKAVTPTCVVYLLGNSFRYAARQHWDALARSLRPVYTAPTEAAALERFLGFQESWGAKYPAIVRLWESAWSQAASNQPQTPYTVN